MKNTRVFRIAILCFALLALNLNEVAQADESVTISPWANNNYNIPPERSHNDVRFDFTITGLRYNIYYGYRRNVDGLGWSAVTDLGNIWLYGSTYSSYFYESLPYWTHTVTIQVMVYSGGQWSPVAENSVQVTLVQLHSITVQNSFGTGDVIVDQQAVPSVTNFVWEKFSYHSVTAIDGQTSGDYVRRFDYWYIYLQTSSITVSFNVTENATYTAYFSREFNITFQNNFPGASGGEIKVEGSTYTAPYVAHTVEQSPPQAITGEALYQVINSIEYTFSSWSPGGSTSASTTFTPDNHTTYTANFNAKPLPPPNVSAGGNVGDPVQVTWSNHPHPEVTQYQIWRQV